MIDDRVFKIIGTIGEITVVECIGSCPFKDARFTFTFEGRDSNKYFKTADAAFLGGLGRKYLGLNSQFAEFAQKMLRND